MPTLSDYLRKITRSGPYMEGSRRLSQFNKNPTYNPMQEALYQKVMSAPTTPAIGGEIIKSLLGAYVGTKLGKAKQNYVEGERQKETGRSLASALLGPGYVKTPENMADLYGMATGETPFTPSLLNEVKPYRAPIEMGPGTTLYDQMSGKSFQTPFKPEYKDVSAGGSLVDTSTGEPIYTAGPKEGYKTKKEHYEKDGKWYEVTSESFDNGKTWKRDTNTAVPKWSAGEGGKIGEGKKEFRQYVGELNEMYRKRASILTYRDPYTGEPLTAEQMKASLDVIDPQITKLERYVKGTYPDDWSVYANEKKAGMSNMPSGTPELFPWNPTLKPTAPSKPQNRKVEDPLNLR